MTKEELWLVLDALKWCHGGEPCGTAEAIAVVEKALAQPEQCKYPDCKCPTENPCLKGLAQEQKPVAWVWVNNKGWLNYGETPHDMFKSSPLYTRPPQRTWHGLTVEDVHDCLKGLPTQSIEVYARSVEAKLKQKNGYAEEKNT